MIRSTRLHKVSKKSRLNSLTLKPSELYRPEVPPWMTVPRRPHLVLLLDSGWLRKTHGPLPKCPKRQKGHWLAVAWEILIQKQCRAVNEQHHEHCASLVIRATRPHWNPPQTHGWEISWRLLVPVDRFWRTAAVAVKRLIAETGSMAAERNDSRVEAFDKSLVPSLRRRVACALSP